jgi:hypothetical protein
MKTFKIADGNGYEQELEPGTTKQEAELMMAELPGWTLTVTGNDDPKPARQKRKSAYGKGRNHGYWPVSSAIPREESLTRVLKSEVRVRMDDAPVVTYHLDPTDRPVKK